MTREQLIAGCLTGFGMNFAETWAEQVVLSQSLPTLWKLIEEAPQLSLAKPDLGKLQFRSAYILEAVYFKNPGLFSPYLPSFFELFSTVTNGGMRRHFAKIGCHIIQKGYQPCQIDAIATSCADWIIDPQTKVAVKAWALDMLLELSKTKKWVKDLFPEIVASLSTNPSAGIIVRLRRVKSQVSQ